jgi:hypothetical protein
MRGACAVGEGNARGARAVDFKQETWVDGKFCHHKKGTAFPSKLVSSFLLVDSKHALTEICVFRIKKS